jgi:hypothetical protein
MGQVVGMDARTGSGTLFDVTFLFFWVYFGMGIV